MKTLKDLFLEQLGEMYDAEQQQARTLSRFTRMAEHEELREALRVHSYETVGQISKLARVFECFGEPTNGVRGHAMSGLVAEGNALVGEHQEGPAKDAAIVAAVQKMEHYEMATYGCLRDWALELDNREAAVILHEILDEERTGDCKLTKLAHKLINAEALSGGWEGQPDHEGDEDLAPHGHRERWHEQ
jgi:ferritin-like metal-binding protein YciE